MPTFSGRCWTGITDTLCPMKPASLFSFLELANEKPEPFAVYTAKELWTDEHTSAQMLAYHLNGEIDVSSRRTSFIDDSVRWMATRFGLTGESRIVDFGCGPGLYTSRLARLGADVHGIDFSSRSVAYAREQAAKNSLRISYVEADYLEYRPEGAFDLVIMIMCDFCALSPIHRAAMLGKFRELLAADGRIVLDVYSMAAFAARSEESIYEKNQLDGFWSADPYYAFVTSCKYDDEKVSLDKYTIVESDRQREVYNWLQYFSPETLEREADAAGLAIDEIYGDVAGSRYDADAPEFAVVLEKR